MRLGAPALILLGIAAGASAFPGPGPAGAAPGAEPPRAEARVVPGEVLVLGRAPEGVAGGASAGDADPFAFRELAVGRGVRVRELAPLGGGPGGRAAFPGGAWVLRYEGSEAPKAVARRLAADPRVAYAGPNHLVPLAGGAGHRAVPDGGGGASGGNGGVAGTAAATAPGAAGPAVPDDPLFPRQWGAFAARLPEAWTRSRGEGVLIAIIDTGVDLAHPDLASRIAVNAAELNGAPGVDDDGNGYVDDVRGYDFTDAPGLPGVGDYEGRDADPTDDYGHGTEVAGVAAAAWNNGVGIAGAAPGARILPVRAGFRTSLPFLPAVLQEDDAAAAVIYAADRGARVLNLSWGDVVDAPVIGAAVAYARSRGALVVASAGNEPGDLPFYPAAYPGVLDAGASTGTGARAGFSTYGQDLDLLAPGVDILTTGLDGSYVNVGGTSFSAPLTSGGAALVWSLHPEWTAEEVAWRLRETAAGAGWDPGSGWGGLDAASATAPASPPTVVEPEAPRPRPGGARELVGTAAGAGLRRWTVGVAPLASALGAGSGARDLPGERVLVAGAVGQVVAESLAVFTPGPADTGAWILRLRAWNGGGPVREARLRFRSRPAATPPADLQLELQAQAERGWDLLAVWTSTEPYRGRLRFTGADGALRDAADVAVGTHHAVRLRGPLPAGPAGVVIGIQGAEGDPVAPVDSASVTVPPGRRPLVPTLRGMVPAGTPMPETVDLDGDGRPEFFTEDPPEEDEVYGSVSRYELGAPGTLPVRLDGSGGRFLGIPRAVADPAGDGRAELVVYRVDGWGVWRAGTPGAFPTVEEFEAGAEDGVPATFVRRPGGGLGLLVVNEHRLQLRDATPGGGWSILGEASASEARLSFRGAAADFDGDGTLEAVFPNERGGLSMFRIGPGGVEATGTVPAIQGAAAAAVAVPREQAPPVLVSVETEPVSVAAEGDLDRGSVRLRRWRWTGDLPEPGAGLAFAGIVTPERVQILAWPPPPGLPGADSSRVVLRRDDRFDAACLSGAGLEWEPLYTSQLSRVTGAALVRYPGLPARRLDTALWVGDAAGAGSGGEMISLLAADPPVSVGAALRVIEARPVESGLRLVLAAGPDACGLPESVVRTGPGGERKVIPVLGPAVADTLAPGAEVLYRAPADLCLRPSLAVTAVPPEPLAATWAGSDRLSVTWQAPLAGTPESVRLRGKDGLRAPRALKLDRSGTRLLVDLPPGWMPDSLIVVGAWNRNGLPVGGSIRASAPVPPPPAAGRTPVLSTVAYRADAGGPYLEAELGGGSPPGGCALSFRLDPPGWVLGPLNPGGNPLRLPLPEALAAGRYTLVLGGDCLEAPALGLERDFRVGLRIYPNPLPAGTAVTVENAPAGSRAVLLDIQGRELDAWRIEGSPDIHPVKLASGIYLLQLRPPAGGPRETQRLVVLR